MAEKHQYLLTDCGINDTTIIAFSKCNLSVCICVFTDTFLVCIYLCVLSGVAVFMLCLCLIVCVWGE